jgi:hypothetical protein
MALALGYLVGCEVQVHVLLRTRTDVSLDWSLVG